jgi:hypothetical protein
MKHRTGVKTDGNYSYHAGFLSRLFFSPEDDIDIFLRNID